jgi:CPA2 family monovalent cation:H+ antiporter-2
VPDTSLLRDILVLFGLGVLVVLVFHRARLPPLVGFLITGVLCGPYGFRLVANEGAVEAIAEVGVILLLFTIGIEVSVQQLVRLRTFLVAGGGLQVGLTIVAAFVAARAFGEPRGVALFLGFLVALSSTAIVLRLLADRGELDAPHGQAALAILIFQDLCVVPMMLATPVLAGGATGAAVVPVLGRIALFAAAGFVAARWAFPWLIAQVVATRKRDVFLLTVIFLCLGTAWATAQTGLSLALGAFIAGLVISRSEYSHQALGEILPLREVFNALFFVSIGMLFDVRTVLAAPITILALVLGVVAVKAIIASAAAFALGQSLRVSVLAGLAVAQIGEFSFVLSKAGLDAGLLDARHNQILLAVAVGTMALTPVLNAVAPRLAKLLEAGAPARWAAGHALPVGDAGSFVPREDHVVIVGYGLNGRNLARVLGRAGVPFVVIEMNAEAVRAERRRGRPIIYGDATHREILEHARIAGARVLVIAISDPVATRSAVVTARSINPGLHILVRSRYVHEVEPLLALGTDEVIPEEYETSIEIFTRVLRRYLIPRDEIERLTTEIRRAGYEAFRAAADVAAPAARVDRMLHGLASEVVRVEPGAPVAGHTLAECGVRDRSGASLVGIRRPDGRTIPNPSGSDVLEPGDVALLIGEPEQIAAALPLFRAPAPEAPRGTGAHHTMEARRP